MTASGQLTLPATASEVPAKSMRASSPAIVTSTRIGMSASVTPSPSSSVSARYTPSGRRRSASRVRRSA